MRLKNVSEIGVTVPYFDPPERNRSTCSLKESHSVCLLYGALKLIFSDRFEWKWLEEAALPIERKYIAYDDGFFKTCGNLTF